MRKSHWSQVGLELVQALPADFAQGGASAFYRSALSEILTAEVRQQNLIHAACDARAVLAVIVADDQVDAEEVVEARAQLAAVDERVVFGQRHNTQSGQSSLQRVHDVAAEAGAVCSKGNAQMASAHESSGLQAVHDLAVEHGATCNAIRPGSSPLVPYGADAVRMTSGGQQQVYTAPVTFNAAPAVPLTIALLMRNEPLSAPHLAEAIAITTHWSAQEHARNQAAYNTTRRRGQHR